MSSTDNHQDHQNRQNRQNRQKDEQRKDEQRYEKVEELASKVQDSRATSWRRHEKDTLRIKIAGWALGGAGVLIAGAFLLGLFSPIAIAQEINLYTVFLSSLFGIVTLILGFIAGSGIDRD